MPNATVVRLIAVRAVNKRGQEICPMTDDVLQKHCPSCVVDIVVGALIERGIIDVNKRLPEYAPDEEF